MSAVVIATDLNLDPPRKHSQTLGALVGSATQHNARAGSWQQQRERSRTVLTTSVTFTIQLCLSRSARLF
jgi:hypothetical protein